MGAKQCTSAAKNGNSKYNKHLTGSSHTASCPHPAPPTRNGHHDPCVRPPPPAFVTTLKPQAGFGAHPRSAPCPRSRKTRSEESRGACRRALSPSAVPHGRSRNGRKI
uniref:Uncharacterized protein n=1 Tax=Athene cunicularia TaxID=194338 RepID=A0A663MYF4_ATHCN